ncbi:collagen alpha-3(VI) chain-like [Genypterus blacodes]|uniref:collagen alpha-3(VI) chain-like n=1 Tax=Genypterus blacodes TaxID=154954 RepID=UPI003F76BD7F
MRRYPLLPLCALLGVLFAGFLPQFDAQEGNPNLGRKDIIFLIDGSDNTSSAGIAHIRDFIISIVQQLDVQPDQVRVGVVQFADNVKTEFSLNSHNNKPAVLSAVKRLRQMGGRSSDLADAIDYVIQRELKPNAGVRFTEASQHLVVLTGGRSPQDVSLYGPLLKASRVNCIGIGADGADTRQLNQIATTSEDVIKIPTFPGLPAIQDRFIARLRGTIPEETPTDYEHPTDLPQPKQADIVFLVDGSINLGKENFKTVMEFILNLIDLFYTERDNLQIGLAHHATDVSDVFYLNTYKNKDDIISAIGRAEYKGGRRLNTGAAIHHVQDVHFTKAKGSRKDEGIPQILMVVTGGRSADDSKTAALGLKNTGVKVFAVGVGDIEEELENLASVSSTVARASTFQELSELNEQILETLDDEVKGKGGVKATPMTPTVTGNPNLGRKDIIFLIDGSDNTSSAGIAHIRDFIISIVQQLDVQPDQVRVGVVQFADNVKTEFSLNSHNNKPAVLSAVKRLRQMGGRSSDLADAIDYVIQRELKPNAGVRFTEASQHLVVLTGGRSPQDVSLYGPLLKASRVNCIGIGADGADTRQLNQIATTSEDVIKIPTFPGLPAIQDRFIARLRGTIPEETPTDYEHPTDLPQPKQADIVFLVDGSINLGKENFKTVMEFILNLIDLFYTERDNLQIGLAHHATDVSDVFYLNTYKNKDDIISAIGRAEYKGGRRLNTGAAIHHVQDVHFTKAKGSRKDEGIPQILMVVTGGRSADDSKTAALGLKNTGVKVFAVGVGDIEEELENLASVSSTVARASTFQELSELNEQILETLDDEVKGKGGVKATPMTPTVTGNPNLGRKDIIFLIDGSDNTSSAGIAHIRDFIISIVQQLDVQPDQVRVGVVQFADNVKTEFSLNSHNNKPAVLSAVKRLRQMGGRSSDLADAIDYVIQRELKPNAGVRFTEASQHLVVLTGGRSPQDVSLYGPLLKASRVNCIGIGADGADTRQLNQIATTSEDVIKIPTFPGLPAIQDRFIARLRGTIPEETPTDYEHPTDLPQPKQADIVFLVDGSINLGKENFKTVMEFILNLIDLFYTERDNLQIGLAHHATDVSDVFYLNTYKNKDDIISAIGRAEYKGGRRLNTGAAIHHVQDVHFTKAKGSRKDEGIPQILMVVTGGRSADDSKTAALGLKNTGVKVFAVGVGDIEEELENLASVSSTVARASTFQELSELNEQILETLDDEVKGKGGVKATPMTPTVTGNPNLGRKDIIFLIDGSDNTSSAGIAHIRDFIISIVQQLDVQPDQVRVGVVQFADNVKTEFSLNSHNNKPAVLSAVKRLRQMGGRSSDLADAIDYVIQRELKPNAGVRFTEASQHLVVLTGGRSPQDVSLYGPLLKASRVNCIGIGADGADTRQLNQIATTSEDVIKIPTFPGLPAIQDRFIARLRGTIPEETPTDYEHPTDLPQPKQADIVFLVDGSINLGKENFKTVMEFILNLIDLFYTERDNLQIGLAHHATDVSDVFYLNTYKNKDDIISAIGRAEYKGGRRLNTGAAIHHVQDVHFTKAKGSRKDEGIPQILMVVTGGRSADDSKTAALGLKNTGVKVFAVGVGDIEEELENLASVSSTVARASTFQELSELNEQILETLDDEVKGKGGVKATPMTPTVTGNPNLGRKDIIFLIDGSDNTSSAGIAHIRDFIISIVQQLDVQPDQVRVGVVQFADNVKTEFSLNSHNNKPAVLSAVKRLRQMGGRSSDLADAIDYVIQRELKPNAGVRFTEASQHLVVLTGGRSPQDVSLYGPLLKASRVNCIGIGADGADTRQLNQIATTSEDVIKIPTFPGLPAIQDRFIARLRGTIPEETPTDYEHPTDLPQPKQADIVFLVDGSINLGKENFKTVMEFILNLIDLFYTERDNLQIGLAHHATDVSDVFYLNTYKNKDDIISAIGRAEYKGGRRLNTGAAIHHVQDVHFTKAKGSRKDEGIPQILMVVTGGRSADDSKTAALGLKNTGVKVFAVGVGDIEEELENLASVSSTVARASTFQELSELNEQILETLDDEVKGKGGVKATPMTPTVTGNPNLGRKDIIFLIDGSDNTSSAGIAHIRDFIISIVQQLDVQPDQVRVGVVQFADNVKTEFSLNSHNNKPAVLSAVKRLRQMGGRSSDLADAIDYVIQRELKPNAGVRFTEASQHLVVLTGGRSPQDVSLYGPLLKASRVNCIGIGADGADTRQLNQIATTSEDVIKIPTFPGLPAIQDRFIARLRGTIPEETPTDYEHPTDLPQPKQADIVFLVDGSINLGKENFKTVMEFILNLIDLFYTERDNLQIGLAHHATDVSDVFYLNTYKNKDDIISAIGRAEYKGGRRLNTGAAIHHVQDVHFTKAKGSRKDEGIPQILMVVTGGRSADDSKTAALGLKNTGVKVFAVGVGDIEEELENLASVSSTVARASTFQELSELNEQILETLDDEVKGKGGVKATPMTPTVTGNPNLGRKDIIFLIDGSDNTSSAGIAHIRDFIISIVQQLDVQPDQVRVGVVQFADNVKTEFSLNSHNNKPAVLSAVKRLRQMGGRSSDLADAIDYVIQRELKPNAGVRFTEASQHLVVLTGGRSPQDVSLYGPLLKASRVNCIGIGADGADTRQLNQIATTSEDVIKIPTFPGLPAIQDRFIARLRGTIPEETPTDYEHPTDLPQPKQADIVFLVDGSINLGKENFKTVMEFILNLIDLFYTERDNLQIGLAHHATDVSDVFYLNTYKNKDDIISAIGRAEYKGGRRLNTGAAIHHVQDVHFTKAKGSRKDEGIPQILMVVTGGRSADDSKTAALGLKNTGVKVFAVGVGDIEEELENLASVSSTVARASTFQELSELNEQILETLDDEVKGKGGVKATPMTPTVTGKKVTEFYNPTSE